MKTTRNLTQLCLLGALLIGPAGQAATITWTNAAAGGWSTAANWNPNTVPGAGDTAIIASGGVTLGGDTTVGGIILGTNGPGLTTLSLNGHALALNGPLTVNSSGSFTVDGGALLGTNAVLSGRIGWTGGTLGGSLTLAAGGTLNIATANNHYIGGCVFTNAGTVNWSGGYLYAGGGAVFYNYGLWNAQDDQYFYNYYGGAGTVFNNYGTFRKSGGASEFATATVFPGGVTFNQLAGVIDVQNGTNGLQLVFQNGGSFTGGYITTNQFGLTVLAGGSFNLNGTVTGTNTWETGNLVGTNVINGALTWQAGYWDNTVVTVPATSVLNITTANNHYIGYCILTNSGTVNWSGSGLYAGGGTVVYNYGLWNAQDDQTLSNYRGAPGTVFNNFGTFRKSGGNNASQTLLGNPVTFNNTGIVDVQNGNLLLQGIGNFTGGYITPNSTGTTYFSSGNFNLNGTATGTNVIESAAANLVGTNVIKGALNWQGGYWDNTVVTVPATSVLNITTPNNHYIGYCLLTNSGTVNWSGGGLFAGGGTVVYNYGLWNAQDDQTLSNYRGAPGTVFNNFGTFRKSGGNNASQTLIGNAVSFNNTGIVDVQQGNLILQGDDTFTGGYITTNSTGTTYFSSGNFNLNGTATGTNVIENGANLVGTIVIKGALNWQNGSWNNTVVTVPATSVLNITTANNHYLGGCLLNNSGIVNWSGGGLYAGGGAAFYNYGLWNAQDDQVLSDYYGSPNTTVFNNFGIFRKSGGISAGQTLIGNPVTFNSTGIVDVQQGNLVFQGNDSFTGGYLNTNSTGTTYLSAGNFNINGTVTGNNVIESAGNLVGTNVINGALTWQNGSWNNTVVTVSSNSVVNIATANNHYIGYCIITNFGTVNWSGGGLFAGGGTFLYNYGLWNAQGDQTLYDYYGSPDTVFNNFGTFRKEFTSGTTALGSGVTFNNSGKLDAQDGNIALQGAYTLANGTKMGFGLGGSAGNGSISLSGPASFAGSASVNLRGFFWPAAGSVYNLLNYTSESGLLFTNLTLPATGYITWQTNYNATAFALSVLAHIATNTTPTNLFISTLNSSTIILQWPGDHTGWSVQAQTNPATTGIGSNWATLVGAPLTNQFVMPINKTNATVFFRMTYP